MTAHDELRDLWNCQPAPSTATGEDMMTVIQQRIRGFDRTVWIRNLVECIAGIIVFALFVWLALRANSALIAAGELIVAASAVWIIIYLVRYGQSPTRVDPNRNLMSYTRALIESYDRQIRLLRSAKYWYLLPMYVGVLTISAGVLVQHAKSGAHSWWDIASPVISTAFFAAVWWLNEVVVVRRLLQCRCKALSMAGVDEFQDESSKEEQ